MTYQKNLLLTISQVSLIIATVCKDYSVDSGYNAIVETKWITSL